MLSECGFLVLYCLIWAMKALWGSPFLYEECQAHGCLTMNEVGGLKLYCFQFCLLAVFFPLWNTPKSLLLIWNIKLFWLWIYSYKEHLMCPLEVPFRVVIPHTVSGSSRQEHTRWFAAVFEQPFVRSPGLMRLGCDFMRFFVSTFHEVSLGECGWACEWVLLLSFPLGSLKNTE